MQLHRWMRQRSFMTTLFPIQDPDQPDARRASIGLETVAEYRKLFGNGFA